MSSFIVPDLIYSNFNRLKNNRPGMEIMRRYLERQRWKTILFFVLIYAVGVAGLQLPQTEKFFILLIPIALLISFIAILLFHKSLNSANTRFVFFLIFLLSFLVEVTRISSTEIFGNLSFGEGLGFKLFATPAMIGIYWVMLVYCSASIMERFKLPNSLKILSSSLLILLYDLVLEQIAPFFDMWHWKHDSVPLLNYLVWFILAVCFHTLVKWKKVKTENPLAPAIFICQFLFFLGILLLFK